MTSQLCFSSCFVFIVVIPWKMAPISKFIDFINASTFKFSYNTLELVLDVNEEFRLSPCRACLAQHQLSGIMNSIQKESWTMLDNSTYSMRSIVSMHICFRKTVDGSS